MMKKPGGMLWTRDGKKLVSKTITDAESAVLELVLDELRHANALGEQLHIDIDPYLSTDGANVFFSYNLAGCTYRVEGKIGKRIKLTPASKTAARDARRMKARK